MKAVAYTRCSTIEQTDSGLGLAVQEECIRPGRPLTLADSRHLVERYVTHYNEVRLHSAIGFVAPTDKLNGHDEDIFTERDRKLAAAREQRRRRRQLVRDNQAARGTRIQSGLRVPGVPSPRRRLARNWAMSR